MFLFLKCFVLFSSRFIKPHFIHLHSGPMVFKVCVTHVCSRLTTTKLLVFNGMKIEFFDDHELFSAQMKRTEPCAIAHG